MLVAPRFEVSGATLRVEDEQPAVTSIRQLGDASKHITPEASAEIVREPAREDPVIAVEARE